VRQYAQNDRQLAAEGQQKVWTALLEILKLITALSTAIVGAWAIIFSDTAKIPTDWKKWLIVVAIILAVLSVVTSLFAIFHINRQIVGISRGILSVDETPKSRYRIIILGNLAFIFFLFSGLFVIAYVVSRAMSPPTDGGGNNQSQIQTQTSPRIQGIRARKCGAHGRYEKRGFGFMRTVAKSRHAADGLLACRRRYRPSSTRAFGSAAL
jgi:succinate dehydrogenase hydrophobic anchor subunit